MVKVLLGLLMALVLTSVAATLTAAWRSSGPEGPINQPWAQQEMELVAWNGSQWTAWVRDGAFELVPRNDRKWSRHSNRTLTFTDWRGQPWQARVEGERFLLAYRGDWSGEVEQVEAIRYRDWTGEKRLRTVAQLTR